MRTMYSKICRIIPIHKRKVFLAASTFFLSRCLFICSDKQIEVLGILPCLWRKEKSMQIFLLVGAATVVAILHSILPDHWVPLAIVARTQRWLSDKGRLVGETRHDHYLSCPDCHWNCGIHRLLREIRGREVIVVNPFCRVHHNLSPSLTPGG